MQVLKISLIAVTLTFLLSIYVVNFPVTDSIYGQFFETNSSELSSNFTSIESEDGANIVLLSQKLKKADIIDNRHLVGQVKNIGNDTATSVRVDITTFDKSGGVLGTDYTYVTADSLRPNQKSAFDLGSDGDNFKGMDHYEISLQWSNSDGTEGYVENAKIHKDNTATETETDNSSTSQDDLSKTRAICDTVTTQSAKELCGTLLN